LPVLSGAGSVIVIMCANFVLLPRWYGGFYTPNRVSHCHPPNLWIKLWISFRYLNRNRTIQPKIQNCTKI